MRPLKDEQIPGIAHQTQIAYSGTPQSGELSAGALIETLGMEQANVYAALRCCEQSNLFTSAKSESRYSIRLETPFNHDEVLN